MWVGESLLYHMYTFIVYIGTLSSVLVLSLKYISTMTRIPLYDSGIVSLYYSLVSYPCRNVEPLHVFLMLLITSSDNCLTRSCDNRIVSRRVALPEGKLFTFSLTEIIILISNSTTAAQPSAAVFIKVLSRTDTQKSRYFIFVKSKKLSFLFWNTIE